MSIKHTYRSRSLTVMEDKLHRVQFQLTGMPNSDQDSPLQPLRVAVVHHQLFLELLKRAWPFPGVGREYSLADKARAPVMVAVKIIRGFLEGPQ